MKETLITYKTALLAKEKGFKFKKISTYEGDLTYAGDRDEDISQSNMQKWLREKHNQHISVVFVECNKYRALRLRKIVSDNYIHEHYTSIPDINVFYQTYEEALEAGLQEALSFISKDTK